MLSECLLLTNTRRLDTDIVVFRNPFVDLNAMLALASVDLAFQVGGSDDLDVPVDELDAYRNELCTGLFLARTSAAALAALEQVIHVIVRPRKLGACLPLHVPLIQVLTKKRVVGYTAGPS